MAQEQGLMVDGWTIHAFPISKLSAKHATGNWYETT